MLRSKTLFVIGAGASAELTFPTGRQLTDRIANRLKRVTRYTATVDDSTIHDALHRHVNAKNSGDLSSYLQAAWTMSEAMPLASSIDTYMDAHQDDERIQLVGKLAILREMMS